jgi:VWFA-related protein
MKRVLTVCSLLLPLAALLFAQSYEVSVTSLSVWVKATDSSGKPVEGLTANDFEIYEDGQKMDITCFEESAPETAPAISGPSEKVEVNAAPEAPKKIAIYLDLFNTNSQEFANVRPRVQQFLDQIATKNWEVMLAALLPNGKLGIISPFTKDIPAVRNVLLKAPANSQRDAADKSRVKQMSTALEEVLNTDPRVQDAALQTAYTLAGSFAKQEKVGTDYSLAALGSFAGYLAQTQGNEHIVVLFVSGGINIDPGRVYFDMAYKVAEQLGFTTDPTKFGLSFQAMPDNNRDIQGQIRASIGKMNRHNVTVYAINTRGMYSTDNSSQTPLLNETDSSLIRDYQDTMSQISSQTGGLSFENSRNFKMGFDQIFTDLGQQYLICYNPPQHQKAGDYHKIKVVCKKNGVDLRYRTGYLDD